MTAVYVVRHAVAEDRDADRWPDDALRPLTADGELRFRSAARGLREIAPSVDALLASPYVRAWQTAEILYEETGWPAPQRCDRLEAWRPPDDVFDVIPQSGSVALVGHEPMLSGLVALLVGADPQLDFKKGGVVLVEDGLLRWYATPKILRKVSVKRT